MPGFLLAVRRGAASRGCFIAVPTRAFVEDDKHPLLAGSRRVHAAGMHDPHDPAKPVSVILPKFFSINANGRHPASSRQVIGPRIFLVQLSFKPEHTIVFGISSSPIYSSLVIPSVRIMLLYLRFKAELTHAI